MLGLNLTYRRLGRKPRLCQRSVKYKCSALCIYIYLKNIPVDQITFFMTLTMIWISVPSWDFDSLDLLQSLNLQSVCEYPQYPVLSTSLDTVHAVHTYGMPLMCTPANYFHARRRKEWRNDCVVLKATTQLCAAAETDKAHTAAACASNDEL